MARDEGAGREGEEGTVGDGPGVVGGRSVGRRRVLGALGASAGMMATGALVRRGSGLARGTPVGGSGPRRTAAPEGWPTGGESRPVRTPVSLLSRTTARLGGLR